MEDLEMDKKLSLKEATEIDNETNTTSTTKSQTENEKELILDQLRKFLLIQERRALAYANLKRGFSDYMVSRVESAYQQLCSDITLEFNDCSKQVLEMEALFRNPIYNRDDLAQLLRAVQSHEKNKLHLTAIIQVLKKTGRPSERPSSHENCRITKPIDHECLHSLETELEAGVDEAEADAEYDNALKEAIRGVQTAVTEINEHLEDVKYEIDALEVE